jgi:hypothetical protein
MFTLNADSHKFAAPINQSHLILTRTTYTYTIGMNVEEVTVQFLAALYIASQVEIATNESSSLQASKARHIAYLNVMFINLTSSWLENENTTRGL